MQQGDNFKLVVIRQGWVFAGQVVETVGGILMPGAKCVRRWGTTQGLGEIAEGGPTNATILDRMGLVNARHASVLFTLDCDPDAWRSWLAQPSALPAGG